MNKQFICIVVALFSNYLASQQYIIKYKYTSKSDSAIYNLVVDKNASVFEIEKYNVNPVNTEQPIKKNDCDKLKILRNGNKLNVTDNIEAAKVISTVPVNLKWKLEKGNHKFLQYNTKVASTVYDDKKWIAEYTTDIPINDGPFIFKFLPGLITKIENENREVIFQLVSVEKTTKKFECNTDNLKKLDFEKYVKLIHQKQEIENSVISSLKNLPGINIGDKKLEKIDYDPVKYLLK